MNASICRFCDEDHDGAAICPYCGAKNTEHEDYDPTPYCHMCGAGSAASCHCGPYAENH